MSKTQVSTNGQVGIQQMLVTGQAHKYVLNDDKAKRIMVTNSALPPISAPDVTPQTSKLQLSTGSFSQVIQPLFSYWGTFDLSQAQKLVEGGTEVTLKEVIMGTEQKNKKVDFLAKFEFQGKSISLFAYCTNQCIMVQGLLHVEFLNCFLTPLLAKMISAKSAEINDFNDKVKSLLKTTSKSAEHDDSVWTLATPDRESLNVKLKKSTKCDMCGRVCAGISQLKIHITNAHSDNTRAKPRSGVKHSRMIVTTVPSNLQLENNLDVLNLLDTSDDDNDDEPLEISIPRQSSPVPSPPLPPTPLPGGSSRRRSHSSPGAAFCNTPPPPPPPPPVTGNTQPLTAPPSPPATSPASTAPVDVQVEKSSDEEVTKSVEMATNKAVQVLLKETTTAEDTRNTETVDFNFSCIVCGKGLNTTNVGLQKHVESNGGSKTLVLLMNLLNSLKTTVQAGQAESVLNRNEIASLKEEVIQLKTRVSQRVRTVTPLPALQGRPPAPAEYVIKSGGASKVLLLHHVPRYDTHRSDPLGARPQLARLANTHLEKARDASELAEHILVGEHTNMECEGITRTNRFTNDQTHIKNYAVRLGKYDGIHLYSLEGALALTSSLLAILHKAGMVRRPQQWGLSSSSSANQWTRQVRGRGFRGNNRNQTRQQARGNEEFQIPVGNRFQNFQ